MQKKGDTHQLIAEIIGGIALVLAAEEFIGSNYEISLKYLDEYLILISTMLVTVRMWYVYSMEITKDWPSHTYMYVFHDGIVASLIFCMILLARHNIIAWYAFGLLSTLLAYLKANVIQKGLLRKGQIEKSQRYKQTSKSIMICGLVYFCSFIPLIVLPSPLINLPIIYYNIYIKSLPWFIFLSAIILNLIWLCLIK